MNWMEHQIVFRCDVVHFRNENIDQTEIRSIPINAKRQTSISHAKLTSLKFVWKRRSDFRLTSRKNIFFQIAGHSILGKMKSTILHKHWLTIVLLQKKWINKKVESTQIWQLWWPYFADLSIRNHCNYVLLQTFSVQWG